MSDLKAEFRDGKVWLQVFGDDLDQLSIAVLREGKQLVEGSIAGTISRVLKAGYLQQNHEADLKENYECLAAFNRILKFYGVEND